MKRFRFIAKVLGLILLTVLATVVSGEVLIRLFYFGPDALVHFRRYEPVLTQSPHPLVISPNKRIAFELRPNYEWFFFGKKVKSNSLGLVDERISRSPAQRARTIVMMGESYMEGSGVPLSKRVSSQLEESLQTLGDYAVINMALTNTVLESQIEKFKEKVISAYHPGVVLVAFIPNRIAGQVGAREVWRNRLQNQFRRSNLGVVSFFVFVLRDYLQYAHIRLKQILEKKSFLNGLSKEAQSLAAQEAVDVNLDIHRADRLMDELLDLGRQHHFKVVLVSITPMKFFGRPDFMKKWRDQMNVLAKERNIPVIDTFAFFSGEDVRTCILWLMNRHPNAYANQIFARGIYEKLLELQLVN